jgi:hypothetical protein
MAVSFHDQVGPFHYPDDGLHDQNESVHYSPQDTALLFKGILSGYVQWCRIKTYRRLSTVLWAEILKSLSGDFLGFEILI